MQRLHDTNVFGLGGVVSSRRYEGKSVMEMGNLRPVRFDECSNLAIGLAAPDRSRRQSSRLHAIDRLIVLTVSNHFVPVGFKHCRLRREGMILAPGLLVEIVRAENAYFHERHSAIVVNSRSTTLESKLATIVDFALPSTQCQPSSDWPRQPARQAYGRPERRSS
jgi:hypothetical protein